MYVVVADNVDWETSCRQVRDYAGSLPRVTENYRIYAEPDVGVYSKQLLDAQGVRPGTVEIKSSHRVLYGSPEVPRQLGRFTADAIEPSEGMYLLENRLAEIVEIDAGLKIDKTAGYRRYAHYMLLKSCQDLLTAVLLVQGQYKTTRAERMEVLETQRCRDRSNGVLEDRAVELIRESFKKLLSLPMTVKIEPPEMDRKRRAVECVLLDAWCRIAAEIYASGETGWADTIARRCRLGQWRANSRELLVLGKRMSVPRARLVCRLLRLARMSPVEVLRLAGLVDLLFEHGTTGDVAIEDADRSDLVSGYVTDLDDLTGAFGVRRGTVFERGRELFRKTT
jgi:hypothetical protein